MTRLSTVAAVGFLTLGIAVPGRAQSSEAYVLGHVGASLGDGGAAHALSVGVGYLTPNGIGFEIEVSYVPGLDFGDPGFPRILLANPAIFPPIELDSTGRMVSLHTNAVGVLPGTNPHLRAYVLAGGGVADVKQRVRVINPVAVPPVGLAELPLPPPIVLSDVDISDTALSLAAGAGVEYALMPHLAVGGDVRYQHVFLDPRGLDAARVTVRVSSRF